ncbi:hypothetical protein GCM10010365_50270 [Streptomyces poonensis]|uniref:Uncharacterized protein n=1 Tax=Streptomyces poonensis TaxID=68255 RepID=A0A918PV21_9ACTN|nr:hypothetical protein GCM10010365_50270 [Streptomyces poonensis]GLJ89912.1 hypothetical protein GCM10017589_25130 [Streptomyces poonensis]
MYWSGCWPGRLRAAQDGLGQLKAAEVGRLRPMIRLPRRNVGGQTERRPQRSGGPETGPPLRQRPGGRPARDRALEAAAPGSSPCEAGSTEG